MEDKLKIKVTIGEISIELEGSTSVVLEKFEELKTSGLGNLGNLVSNQNLNVTESKTISKKVTDKNEKQTYVNSKTNSTTKFPSLREINLKGVAKNEPEWILVYGFYAGDYGQKEFTREDILQLYKDTKRETKTRKGNLTNNLKNLLKQGKIRFLNDNEILLTPEGIEMVKEIIGR